VEILILDSFVTFSAISDTLGMVGNALSVILGLGAVIFFHELGHFAVAKWCDVHVERFSIGIGPIIWSRQKGETEYALSALPFGGYVKMLGQDDMDPNQMTSDEIAENERSYSAKKVWQRMAIISAGVIMNVITGFLFFATAYWFGVVQTVPMVGYVVTGGPAWNVGIRPGDMIESIDGAEIRTFSEINQAVVLSSGSIRIEGTHADGSELNEVIQPKMGDVVRLIGLGPAGTSTLSPETESSDGFTLPGFPSQKASEPFLPGDRVVAVNGEPVEYLHEISYLTAKYAAEDITYTVERAPPGAASAEGDAKSSETKSGEKVEITVPPQRRKSMGLVMAIGKVTAIAKGSLAEKAGLKLDDQIKAVNGLEVSKELDPLMLPNYFADHAGEVVTITVVRQREGDSSETLNLEVTPNDEPGWASPMASLTDPLAIPAIGAGFHIQPWIAKIETGSVAEKSGKFKANQKISMVVLEQPDPKNPVADRVEATEYKIQLDDRKAEEMAKLPVNWAYVHAQIQQLPTRQVRVHVAKSPDGEGSFAHLFKTLDSVDDWYITQRGIDGWGSLTNLRVAQSLGDAAALGFRDTKGSTISIYLTLRSLFQGNLSPKALSGPVGIVNLGYKVADHGMSRLLVFLGFLSINLAVLNFLPIPILDGGHMVFLIWEAVARKKPSPKVINLAHGVGLIFIITLFVFVLYLDIFVNGFGAG